VTNKILIACPKDLEFLRPVIDESMIRIGNSSDGGYAMSRNALVKTERVLSLGLGENWSFEEALAASKPGINIEVYDHTVTFHYFLKKSIKGIIKLILLQESLANVKARFYRLNSYLHFWIKKDSHKHHKYRVTKSSFSSILEKYDQNSNIGLKVDIEGSEWEILSQISSRQESFSFVILEIHDFETREEELKIFIERLSKNFYLAHLHANNFSGVGKNGFPLVFELTFLRKFSNSSPNQLRSFLPVFGLDSPNARNRPDFEIYFDGSYR
jgi:hypothetical protein